MIRLENISMEYPIGDSVCHALQDISLSIPDGQFVSIVGRSGSGKSTLLQIASGLAVPTHGKGYYQDNNEDALIMWTENIFYDKFKSRFINNKENLKQYIEIK